MKTTQSIFPVLLHQLVAGPDVSKERSPGRSCVFPAAAEAETGSAGDDNAILPQSRRYGPGETGGQEEEKHP